MTYYDLAVLGSSNHDLILKVARLPAMGETVLAQARSTAPGGKGANQAVAAARSGASVAMLGAVGTDDEGRALRNVLTDAGVDTWAMRDSVDPTGLAVVVVDEAGQNLIVVDAGANGSYRSLGPAELDLIGQARVLLCQLEVPVPTVMEAAHAARQAGVQVVLNAAPSRPLPTELWELLDLLIVNEHEAADLAGLAAEATLGDIASALLTRVPNVVITLGSAGAAAFRRDGEPLQIPAPEVTAVDTTGAGDTFSGVLAAEMARKRIFERGLQRASAAASLSVQAAGAIPAIPLADRIDEWTLASYPDFAEEPSAAAAHLYRPRRVDQATIVPLAVDADLSILDEAKILAAPDDPVDWPAWRVALKRWRSDARSRTSGLDDHAGPDWAASCHHVRLVWLWDERLYDRQRRTFTIDEFVAQDRRVYGGFDAVVLWHAYPVVGLDERNQWDFYRDVAELPGIIAAFQRHGVRVFLNYNPWEVGTRRTGRGDAEELAELLDWSGADGAFLDTLKRGDADLVQALKSLDRPRALETESRVPLRSLADHALSWAQWFADSRPPGVLRAHLFDRRHMMHHTRRWNRDHSEELQSAWVNGCGMLVWDDVFGVWVGWNDRDRATLQAMQHVQRTFGTLLREGSWEPLVDLHPDAITAGVYAHRYRLGDTTLWTVVNRGNTAWSGPVLTVPPDQESWFEVCHDAPIRTEAGTVGTTVPARGIAGLLRTAPAGVDATRAAELVAASRQRPALTSTTFQPRPIADVHPAARATGPRSGTVPLRPGWRVQEVVYRRRETGQGDEVRWVNTWKPLPPELHAIVREHREVVIGAVAVDEHEVTIAQFRDFLDATGYQPAESNRFLVGTSGQAPDRPVTGVSLDDARAYAAWRGARLPTPAEWAAGEQDGTLRRREPLVWNLTSVERTDGVTRYTILVGGSAFAARGAEWYPDGGQRPPGWEFKYLLPGGGLERSVRIGFRCAVDLEEPA